MLRALLFYLFIWWFKKSDNKKELIARSILAIGIGAFCFIAGIIAIVEGIAFSEEVSWVLTCAFIFLGILYVIIAILFIIRAISDINKILKMKSGEAKGQQIATEEQQSGDAEWSEKADEEEQQCAIARSEAIEQENEARKKLESKEAQKQKSEQDTRNM